MAVAVAAVALLLAATPAAASPDADQERPYRVVWSGSFQMFGEEPNWCPPDLVPVHIEGSGIASHMGAIEVETWHCSDLDAGEFVLGVEVITAANGDELHGTYTGLLTPITETEWTCDTYHVYDGGTGRFSNASGVIGPSTTAITFTSPIGGVLGGEVVGTISFDASDRRN
jgi:hypothetical protein